jgi:large subunit ribosomal protein L25
LELKEIDKKIKKGAKVTICEQVRGAPRKELMKKITIKAGHRKITGKKVKSLRREGKLPAIVYGFGIEPTPIEMDASDATKILSSVGSSTLVTIDIEGKEYATLVRERQRDVIYRNLTHVDFQAVSMTETVRANVPIYISEEAAPAVENYGAMINTGIDVLEIECLPQDLPERIDVDISNLIEIGDSILVRDIILPAGVVTTDDPETLIAVASSPISEEELEEIEEVTVTEEAEPEVIEKGILEESDGEDRNE